MKEIAIFRHHQVLPGAEFRQARFDEFTKTFQGGLPRNRQGKVSGFSRCIRVDRCQLTSDFLCDFILWQLTRVFRSRHARFLPVSKGSPILLIVVPLPSEWLGNIISLHKQSRATTHLAIKGLHEKTLLNTCHLQKILPGAQKLSRWDDR